MSASSSVASVASADVVRFTFQEIVDPKSNLHEKIEKAFGSKGLGIAIVSGVPQLLEKRNKMLQYSQKIVNLPNSIETMQRFNKKFIGWQHQSSNPEKTSYGDALLGSFYARAAHDTLPILPANPELEEAYRNVWPDAQPELKGFRESYEELGRLLISVPELMAKHLEAFVRAKDPKVPENFIVNYFKEHDSQCGLNTFYPLDSLSEKERAEYKGKISWMSWHRDFDLMTALCRAKYFTSDGNEVTNLPNGLSVKDKNGNVLEVDYADDEIGLQIGDALAVLSAGQLHSNPHCVKLPSSVPSNVMRAQFVGFVEPLPQALIRSGNNESIDSVLSKDPLRQENSVVGVYKDNIDYRTFSYIAFSNFFKI